MDTVTESRLAIALAREGGLGVIHKNLSIEDQVNQVIAVKRSESFVIDNPVTMPPATPLGKALSVMHQFGITGIPIVEDGVVVGMLTQRDIRFATDPRKPVSHYMFKGKIITVPIDSTLEHTQAVLREHRIEKLPVVDSNNKLVGLITAKDIQKNKMFPNACKDEKGRLRVGAAVGVVEGTMARVKALVEAGVDVVCVDTAHGHSEGVMKMVSEIKAKFPESQIIAGNVATAEGARDLARAGADGVKVGIGAGAICTTRVIAGIGVPQMSAILDCAEGLAEFDVPMIADGGIRYSGDIAKALAAGASSVMLGSILAGMEESPGEVVLSEGRSYKVYYGMGSLVAMKKGSADRYFQEGAEADKLVPEGIEGKVPYKGKISDTVFQLMGGLKAAMGYCGCLDMESFRKDPRFVQITSAGVRENHPHDVIVTREAPNYHVNM